MPAGGPASHCSSCCQHGAHERTGQHAIAAPYVAGMSRRARELIGKERRQQHRTLLPCPPQVDPAARPSATQLLAMPFFGDSASWLTSEFELALVSGAGAAIAAGNTRKLASHGQEADRGMGGRWKLPIPACLAKFSSALCCIGSCRHGRSWRHASCCCISGGGCTGRKASRSTAGLQVPSRRPRACCIWAAAGARSSTSRRCRPLCSTLQQRGRRTCNLCSPGPNSWHSPCGSGNSNSRHGRGTTKQQIMLTGMRRSSCRSLHSSISKCS